MTLYPLTSNIDNISIGPCHVYFGGTHIGHTYGGVTVSVTQSVYQLKTDQYGETPVRVLEGGLRIEVTANMTESTFENLKMLFSSYTDQTDHLTFGKPVGTEIIAEELVLEPIDGSEIFQIYKAAPNIGEAVEIAYTTDNQRVLKCKFVGLVDTTRVSGDQLFRIGGFSSS